MAQFDFNQLTDCDKVIEAAIFIVDKLDLVNKVSHILKIANHGRKSEGNDIFYFPNVPALNTLPSVSWNNFLPKDRQHSLLPEPFVKPAAPMIDGAHYQRSDTYVEFDNGNVRYRIELTQDTRRYNNDNISAQYFTHWYEIVVNRNMEEVLHAFDPCAHEFSIWFPYYGIKSHVTIGGTIYSHAKSDLSDAKVCRINTHVIRIMGQVIMGELVRQIPSLAELAEGGFEITRLDIARTNLTFKFRLRSAIV